MTNTPPPQDPPEASNAAGAGCMTRLVRWFVRGTKTDGTRWESGHKHDTREFAEAEIEQWGPEMGDMKIMRVTYPKDFEHLREQDGNHYGPPNAQAHTPAPPTDPES